MLTSKKRIANWHYGPSLLYAMILLIFFTGTACSGGGETTAAKKIDVPILSMNDSGQTGNAVLRNSGPTSTEVHIRTNRVGASFGDAQNVAIYQGTCDALGTRAHEIKDILYGESEPPTRVKASMNDLRTGNFVINVHAGDDWESKSTACGVIPSTI